MSTRQEDRWLLPRRQTEYPAREMVAEARLHARREATFLALATLFVASLASLLLLGTAHVIDLSALIASIVPDVELPTRLQLPLGVAPAALGFIAVMLGCELYGRRRAAALVVAGLFVAGALIGITRVADLVDQASATLRVAAHPVGAGAFDGRDAAFASAVALAAGAFVAHVASFLVFDTFRRAFGGRHVALRAVLATLVAQPASWAVYFAVAHAWTGIDADAIAPLALGSIACTVAVVLVLALPLAITARTFALYLRVGRLYDDDDFEPRRLPPALVVDDEPAEPAFVARRRPARVSLQPFSSGEMRFFEEGDQLEGN